jgi:magnesium transporter
MISVYHFQESTGLRKGLESDEIAHIVRSGEGVLWVDFESPTDDETLMLDELFAFHPLAIEDCREASDYPKLDDLDKYLFLVMLAPDLLSAEQEDPVLLGLNVFLGATYVVTYHKRALRSISNLRALAEKSASTVMGKGPAFLSHAILDALVDQYYAAADSLDDAVERYQGKILQEPRKEILDRILALRSHVSQLRRIVADERNLMAQFSKGIRTLIDDEVQMYFSDLYEHLDELSDQLDIAREALGGARDLYLSVSAHRTNESMRILALIATMMLPMTFITGLYGMNITLPGQGSPTAFIWLAGGMLMVALAFFFFFRHQRWI